MVTKLNKGLLKHKWKSDLKEWSLQIRYKQRNKIIFFSWDEIVWLHSTLFNDPDIASNLKREDLEQMSHSEQKWERLLPRKV